MDENWEEWWERAAQVETSQARGLPPLPGSLLKYTSKPCDEEIRRVISLYLEKNKNIDNITFINFITNFLPREIILRKYCNRRRRSGRDIIHLDIRDNIPKIFEAYLVFLQNTNLENLLRLLNILNDYFDILFEFQQRNVDPSDSSWEVRCPLIGNEPNTLRGCKKDDSDRELKEYVILFFDFFVHLLEYSFEKNPEIIQFLMKIDHMREIEKLFTTFFLGIGLLSMTIYVDIYKSYFDKINHIVGSEWFILDCFIPVLEDSSRVLRYPYTCGRAFIVMQNPEFEDQYICILFKTIDDNNDNMDIDQILLKYNILHSGVKKIKKNNKFTKKIKKNNKFTKKIRKNKKKIHMK